MTTVVLISLTVIAFTTALVNTGATPRRLTTASKTEEDDADVTTMLCVLVPTPFYAPKKF